MGCISSKIMSRAVSFHEDRLNHSRSRRKSNGGLPLLEMFTSTPGTSTTHQLLANQLVSSSTGNKIQTELGFNFPSSSNTFPKSATELEPHPPPITHTINTWELMKGLEEEQAVLQQPQESSMSATLLYDLKKSKSCQWLLADDEGELYKLGNRGSTVVRSTSFHTVEEYDALLQKIWLSGSIPINDDYQSSPDQHPNHNDVDDTEETAKSPWLMHKQQQHLLRDDNSTVTEEEGIGIRPCHLDSSTVIPSSSSTEDKRVITERRIHEKGLRRRAIAKGLESLKIPPTTSIEFPTPPEVTNFRKWAFVDDYSPGVTSSSYVTPKFGSYNVSSSSSGRLGKEYYNWGVSKEEEMMLNPELVAAFEECMQQLQLEEESLLKQIIEANATMDKEAQEDDDLIKAE